MTQKTPPFLPKMEEVEVEATTGFEPVIRVLQTLALPLGHVAWNAWILAYKDSLVKESPAQESSQQPSFQP